MPREAAGPGRGLHQTNLFTNDDDAELFGTYFATDTDSVFRPTGNITFPVDPSLDVTCTLPKVTVFL